MADDLNGHYVLTFRSPGIVDGGQRPVRVASVRPGVTVRSSRGHWADSVAETYGAAASLAEAPVPRALPVRRTSTLIQPWFGVTHAADGGLQVSFVWEPARLTPGTARTGRVPARVALRVAAEDGAAIFEGVVMSAGPGSGTGSKAVFHAPAGRLRVEMRIEDDRAEYLDFDVRDVDVGAPERPVALGTAQVFRTRNAREYRAVAGDLNAVPAASREFSRAERLVIRVPVSVGGAGVPAVTATLANAFGQVMRTLTAAPGPSPDLQQIDLPLAGLVAGDYRLEITAAAPLGAAREAVSLRVLP
jgi:hypothetical protein